MNIALDTLLSFTPRRLQARLAANPLQPLAPAVERFPAVVFWADISGFTSLTEKMVAQADHGVEILSHTLNDYFAHLIDLIDSYQGDIVKFAGDGLLAVWSGADLTRAAAAAAQCALAIQSRLRAFRLPDGDALLLRIGLAHGDVTAFYLGGVLNRWEFVVLGEGLALATAVDRDAAPGQVAVAGTTWPLLAGAAGEPLASGSVILTHGPAQPPPTQVDIEMTPAVRQALPAALHAYLPGAAVARLAAGQRRWLAELRRVSVLFVRLPALDYTALALADAQALMQDAQTALYRFEGSLNKISMDDKGIVILAAFGLPPLSHEDDPTRAVLAAQEIQQVLTAHDVNSVIGVATGQAFCGMIGNQRRREYTMIGDVVNLAARLMQAAGHDGPILVDERTRRAAGQQIAFTTLAPVTVKGKRAPVAVFQPQTASPARLGASAVRSEMIGRQQELSLILREIQQLQAGQGGVVVVEGEAGIGKSRLVDNVAQSAGDVRLLVGSGNAIEKFTTYFAWRAVLLQLFGIEQPAGSLESGLIAARHQLTDADREQIRAKLADWLPELATLAPLLNDILPIDLPDNDLTRQMQGQGRAINTQKLLLALLNHAAQTAPLLLILEDAHWLDTSSWALVRQIQRQLPSLLLLVVTRPPVEPAPADYAYLIGDPAVTHLKLDVLPAADVAQLIRQRLGVASVDETVIAFIRRKAEGHPFFSEELAYALRDGGLLVFADDHCRLAGGVEDLEKLSFPDTLQGVITSRIDLLPPPEQLALKVASVIGRVFAFQVLREVYPIQDDKSHLSGYLDTLAQLDLTPLDTPEPDLSYIFKHIITQEVAYNLMLFTQRQQLHEAVARWYERVFAGDLAPYYSLLAHHWTQAAVWDKAVAYLAQAGEQALQRYATQEAVRLLSDALQLEAAHLAGGPAAAAPLQRAYWQRLLGTAQVLMGNLPEARGQLESALALLGSPLPASERARGLALLAEVGRQALHLLWPGRFVVGPGQRPAPTAADQQLLEHKYMAYEALSEVYFFGNDRLGTLYCVIRRLNVLEQAAPIPERARAYSGACIAAGLIPLRRLARHYERQARRGAEDEMPLVTWGRMQLDLNLYRLGAAAPWAQTIADLQRAQTMYTQLGDHHRLGEVMTLLSLAVYYNGQIADSQALIEALARLAVSENNEQQEIWSHTGRARNYLTLGRLQETVATLKAAQILLARNADHASSLIAEGTLARAYWALGDRPAALAAAEKALLLIRAGALTAFPVHIGFEGAAHVFMGAWEAAPAERDKWEPLVKETCRAFQKFARVFPLGAAEAERASGRYAWLLGDEKKAAALLEKSLMAARQHAQPYEEGRTLLLLARQAEGAERARLAAAAATFFERVGATWELAQAQALV